MAQHDYVIANGTGAAVRSDLNNALAAIVSQNSGATEPATTYAYQFWADTTTNLLKLRNSANSAWITLFQLDGEWSTLAVENGTAAAPSIYFKDSGTDTGFYSPGTDQVAVSTAGTGRLFINASGLVGIGTSSPTLQFEISNGTNTGYLHPGVGTGLSVGTKNSSSLTLDTNNTTRVTVTSAGLVGIGTSSPSEVLTVSGKIQATTEFKSETGNDLRLNTGSANRDIFMQVNGSTLMTVQGSTGRVGIGTSTFGVGTSNELSVNGSSSSSVSLRRGDALAGYVGCTSSAMLVNSVSNLPLLFYTNDTERARIDTSGRLLVGTTSSSGVNSNTAPVLAGNFASFTGSVSTNHNTATTLFALENLNATYMVTAVITGTANASAYHAVYIIGSIVTNSHSIQALKAGSLLTLSLSGANVQATQSSGTTQTVTWSVTRMANL